MCLSRYPVQCSFQTNGVTLKQTEKFKYLGVIFSSDCRQDNEAPALPISCTETRTVCKSKAFCSQISFFPILTYGHECWVMTERARSRVQAAEMGFLRKVRGLSLLDKVKSNDIRQFLNNKLLLFYIARTTLYRLKCV